MSKGKATGRQLRGRVLAGACAALAAAAAAPAAWAAVASGTYNGRVNQSDLVKNHNGKISLTVHGATITKLKVVTEVVCVASNMSQAYGEDTYAPRVHIRIHGSRFSWQQTGSGSDFSIKGQFKANRVTGTVYNQFTDPTYGYCTTSFHQPFAARR